MSDNADSHTLSEQGLRFHVGGLIRQILLFILRQYMLRPTLNSNKIATELMDHVEFIMLSVV